MALDKTNKSPKHSFKNILVQRMQTMEFHMTSLQWNSIIYVLVVQKYIFETCGWKVHETRQWNYVMSASFPGFHSIFSLCNPV